MNSAEAKRRTILLNGVEVGSIEPTGNSAKDLAVARRFLAEQGIEGPQERLTLRAKIARLAEEVLLSKPQVVQFRRY